MSRLTPWRIAAAAALLLGALTALVVHEERLRASGREVLLASGSVDPRSLLSGHYAQLDIVETLPRGAPCPAGGAEARSFLPDFGLRGPPPTGWIGLRRSGGHDVAVRMAPTRAEALAGADTAIRGRMRCIPSFDAARGGQVSLDIGISRFHADQAQAQALEAAARQAGPETPALAVVSVGSDGRARLKGVIVGGRRTEISWR